MNPNNPNFRTEAEWEERYYKLRTAFEKLKAALEFYAKQTETVRVPCNGNHAYYSSMHPNADVTCHICGNSEDGPGRDLPKTTLTKSGEIARQALREVSDE